MIRMAQSRFPRSVRAGVITLLLAVASPAAFASNDPIQLYGDRIAFDVYRDGARVGEHRVTFARNPSGLEVVSTFNLAIDILFFRAYEFAYRSQSEWRDGQLALISADIDDNGEAFRFEATRESEKMTVRSPDGSLVMPAPIFPTNHWNAGVRTERQVLNTLTGRLNNVEIVPKGEQTVATENGSINATHYAYTGDLDTEVWYDGMGRWVKLRFTGRDGSTIEYKCRLCQGPSAKTANR